MDTRRLAGALRGNNSITILAPRQPCSDVEKLVLVEALAENEGIVVLVLNLAPISDEMWNTLWQSIGCAPHET
jgi:hypothetical protein